LNFYKILKTARGNIPIMEDQGLDPYRRKSPGDGQGWDLNRAGNEETIGHGSGMGGGLGTRLRRFAPTDFSQTSEDDYSQQIKEDIPYSDHYLLEDYNVERDSPTDLFAFDAEDSPFLSDKLNRTPDPVGPHNQHKPGVFRKVKEKLK